MHVGPKGSGKTILAVFRALKYARGQMVRTDGTCVCGDPECSGIWPVYSNIKSTWEGHADAKGKGWARPLKLAEHLVNPSSTVKHCVILCDEGYQYMDGRRSQLETALDITDSITQSRKGGVLLLLTGVSFDWFDRRVREQVRKSYNCWTPDEGRRVYAVVTTHSVAHLPPWIRSQLPSEIRWWWTGSAKPYYNTYERIEGREELSALGSSGHNIFVQDAEGKTKMVPLYEFIDRSIIKLAGEGQTAILPRQICDDLEQTLKIPVPELDVIIRLKELAFLEQPGGEFVISMQTA